jgi:hypothetical protein
MKERGAIGLWLSLIVVWLLPMLRIVSATCESSRSDSSSFVSKFLSVKSTSASGVNFYWTSTDTPQSMNTLLISHFSCSELGFTDCSNFYSSLKIVSGAGKSKSFEVVGRNLTSNVESLVVDNLGVLSSTTEASDCYFASRVNHQLVVYKGRMYLIGGSSPTTQLAAPSCSFRFAFTKNAGLQTYQCEYILLYYMDDTAFAFVEIYIYPILFLQERTSSYLYFLYLFITFDNNPQ